MSADHAPNPAVLAISLVPLAAVLVMFVGGMVLAGWAFDIVVLKSILPGWVSMKPNAAVGFILIGIALWLTTRPPATFNPERSGRSFSYGNRSVNSAQPKVGCGLPTFSAAYPLRVQRSTFFCRLARLCGLLAGLIGVLTLCEYIFGWNLGIDHWLISEPTGTVGTSHPGRMAPETALCFVLLSAALWIIGSSRKTRWTILASVNLGLLVTALALAAMLSYATPVMGAYGWFGLTIMAMHTAILFAMLGVAVMAINWQQQDVLQWSLSRHTTAAFACGMALLVFIGLNTSRSQFWMNETNRQIAHAEKMLVDAENILAEVIDAQVHSRDYLITGDEKYLKLYLSDEADSQAKLGALYRTEFASVNPVHQQHFTRTEAHIKAQFQWLQQIIDARRTGMNEAARNNMFSHGEDLLDNFRITLDQNKSEDQQIIEQLKRESKSVARFSYISIFFGSFASIMIFLIVIFRLNSAVNERKQKEDKLAESERHFRALTESANDAIITGAGAGAGAGAGNIVGWNAAAERLFGYAEAEIIGQPLTVLIPERFRNPHREGLARVVAGGVPHVIGKTVELAGLRKDGREFPLEFSLAQWQAADGQFFTAIIRDITERKRAGEALRMAEQQQRQLAENLEIERYRLVTAQRIAKIGSWETNLATMSVRWSDETHRIHETDPATFQPVHQSFLDLVHPEDRARVDEALARSLAGGAASAIEHRLLMPDKRIKFVEERWQVSFDTQGVPIRAIGTCQDITERKLAEAKLAEQLDELQCWHAATSGREGRILDLKHEINELLGKSGLPPRYPSAES